MGGRAVAVSRSSIFEFAGGEGAFLALATAHHERCLADPVLNHPFSHPGHPDHVRRLASYWAEVFGGPPAYTAGCGDHSAMLAIHAGTDAEADLGERFVRCFVQAADDAGLPADPEFRAALRSYMTWAVSEVMSYSPAGTQPPRGLPVPRWSWDGLEQVSPA
jgi:hemoglobin